MKTNIKDKFENTQLKEDVWIYIKEIPKNYLIYKGIIESNRVKNIKNQIIKKNLQH